MAILWFKSGLKFVLISSQDRNFWGYVNFFQMLRCFFSYLTNYFYSNSVRICIALWKIWINLSLSLRYPFNGTFPHYTLQNKMKSLTQGHIAVIGGCRILIQVSWFRMSAFFLIWCFPGPHKLKPEEPRFTNVFFLCLSQKSTKTNHLFSLWVICCKITINSSHLFS